MAQPDSRIFVRAYRRRGKLLSRFAHDVELTLTDFEIRVSDGHVNVDFAPASLKVHGALVDGRVDASLLDAAKCAEIERNARRDVLRTERYSGGRFSGRFERNGDRVTVEGSLELLGTSREVQFNLERHGSKFVGTLALEPSRWKIAPYRALLGALELQDRVDVMVEVADTQA